jgi:rfaE bifunctional protein nucleotidyltransferase chain/domain
MSKVVTLTNLYKQLKLIKQQGKKVVLVTGCFDILHSAHELFLRRAKQEGDILIVGLEPDKRVHKLKGKGRPVNRFLKRARNLASLAQVDFVFPLPVNLDKPEIQYSLVAGIKPDILAVSSHTAHLDKKKAMLEKLGGRLKVVLVHNPSISTTKILKEGNFC